MFESFSRSFELVKASFRMLKKEKQLMLFPVLSLVSLLALLASFFVSVVAVPHSSDAVYYGLFFGFYVLCYFIIFFFNTALIACAYKALNGGKPSIGYGIGAAAGKIGHIFVWALISATIGLILRIISERSELLGKIVVAIIGALWSVLTFFVVPVMVFENQNPFAAIKKSGSLIKQTWGESAVGGLSLGLFFIVLAVLGAIPAVLAMFFAPALTMYAVIAMLLFWLGLFIVSSALDGIFVAVLYSYATTGKVPSAMDADTVRRAFGRKK